MPNNSAQILVMKLDVFLSWSGARSEVLARYVNNVLPTIVPDVRLFFSPKIDAGAIWGNELASAIRRSRFAILCITGDNTLAPWLQFEAGALWGGGAETNAVCPLLLGVSEAELPGTLKSFQAKNFDKKGFKELCELLGRKTRLDPEQLRRNFKWAWPALESDVQGGLSALEMPTA